MNHFFHDGTKYIIKGDERLAMFHFHEIRAHLHAMKRTNVYDLKLLTGVKKFDDGTEATYLLDHGIEKINIIAPVYEPEPEEREARQDSRYVPAIRSTDNQYWVVCLSGTFEPPYMVFRNIFNITEEEMEDNVESEIDNKLMSVLGNMELFFIAQTGLMPEKIDYTDPGSGPSDNYTQSGGLLSFNCPKEVWEDFCYYSTIQGYWAYYYQRYESSISSNWSYSVICDGTTMTGLDAEGSSSSSKYGYLFTAVQDSLMEFFGSIYWCPSEDEWFNSVLPSYNAFAESYADTHTTQPTGLVPRDLICGGASSSESWSEYNFIAGLSSIRFDSGSKYCACTYLLSYTSSGSSSSGSPGCEGCGSGTSSGSESYTYDYYIKLDDREFYIYGPESVSYPGHTQKNNNQVKYYGQESPIAVTGLASTTLASAFGVYEEFHYHYIGPNNRNDIITTVFPVDDPGEYEHTIKVNGTTLKDINNNDLLFKGEIFMARLGEV